MKLGISHARIYIRKYKALNLTCQNTTVCASPVGRNLRQLFLLMIDCKQSLLSPWPIYLTL